MPISPSSLRCALSSSIRMLITRPLISLDQRVPSRDDIHVVPVAALDTLFNRPHSQSSNPAWLLPIWHIDNLAAQRHESRECALRRPAQYRFPCRRYPPDILSAPTSPPSVSPHFDTEYRCCHFAPVSLYCSLNSKSAGCPPFQMQKIFCFG